LNNVWAQFVPTAAATTNTTIVVVTWCHTFHRQRVSLGIAMAVNHVQKD